MTISNALPSRHRASKRYEGPPAEWDDKVVEQTTKRTWQYHGIYTGWNMADEVQYDHWILASKRQWEWDKSSGAWKPPLEECAFDDDLEEIKHSDFDAAEGKQDVGVIENVSDRLPHSSATDEYPLQMSDRLNEGTYNEYDQSATTMPHGQWQPVNSEGTNKDFDRTERNDYPTESSDTSSECTDDHQESMRFAGNQLSYSSNPKDLVYF